MPALKHLHSYREIKGRKGFFMCTFPECSHFIAKELIVGKKAICPNCGESFIMDVVDLTYKTVVCKFCHDGHKSKRLRKLRDGIVLLTNELDKSKTKATLPTNVSVTSLLEVFEQKLKEVEISEAIEDGEIIEKPERIEL